MRTKFGVVAAGLMSAMVWGCGGGNDVQGSGGITDDGGTVADGASSAMTAARPRLR
jgi:hypothetical protein